MLRGLGLVERQLWQVEKLVFDKNFPDDALWVRTKRLVENLLKHCRLDAEIEVFETTGDHKDILERLELAKSTAVVFLTRLKDTTESYAFFLYDRDALFGMDPPFRALKLIEPYIVLMKETEAYVRGLGLAQVLEKRLNYAHDE